MPTKATKMNVLQLLEATKQNQAAGLNHTISLHLKHLAGERNCNFIENAIRTFDLEKKNDVIPEKCRCPSLKAKRSDRRRECQRTNSVLL